MVQAKFSRRPAALAPVCACGRNEAWDGEQVAAWRRRIMTRREIGENFYQMCQSNQIMVKPSFTQSLRKQACEQVGVPTSSG